MCAGLAHSVGRSWCGVINSPSSGDHFSRRYQTVPWQTFAATRPSFQITLGRLVRIVIRLLNWSFSQSHAKWYEINASLQTAATRHTVTRWWREKQCKHLTAARIMHTIAPVLSMCHIVIDGLIILRALDNHSLHRPYSAIAAHTEWCGSSCSATFYDGLCNYRQSVIATWQIERQITAVSQSITFQSAIRVDDSRRRPVCLRSIRHFRWKSIRSSAFRGVTCQKSLKIRQARKPL